MAKEQFGAEHLMLGSDYPLGSGSLRDAGIGFTDWFAHACSPVPERSASLMLAKSACANATCARTRASNLLEPVLQWSIVGAMFVAAAIVWPLAPDSLPVHFRINGEANRYGSKVEGLLILPLVIPIANRTTSPERCTPPHLPAAVIARTRSKNWRLRGVLMPQLTGTS
jgi:uncharacterized protein DUF1648